MNLAVIFISGLAIIVLLLVIWVLRDPRKATRPHADSSLGEDSVRHHITYFPQVRQAIAAEDFAFIASRGSRQLARRMRHDRRRVALAYLACLRHDFLKLWRLSRVIARLSPQVAAGQEFARLRLGLGFIMRYEMVRFGFLVGLSPLPELSSLSDAVSRLSIRLETAMSNLGERAALAAEMTSTFNRGGLDTP